MNLHLPAAHRTDTDLARSQVFYRSVFVLHYQMTRLVHILYMRPFLLSGSQYIDIFPDHKTSFPVAFHIMFFASVR